MPASKGDTGFRRAGRLVYRTQMRYPWPVAGPGRATRGRPTLQTSSNHHDLNRLTKTPVTNVVNPSPKTTIISEKALRLTTFVTTDQKSTQKTPWIDDVCNNTHQPTRQRHSAAGMEGAEGTCRGAGGRWRGLAGHRDDTSSHRSATSAAGMEGAGGTCHGAGGRRRGLRRPEHQRRHKQPRNANARQPERAAARSRD